MAFQGPMFSGSSCSQNDLVGVRVALEHLRPPPRTATGRAARRGRPRPARRAGRGRRWRRRRPCPSRTRRACTASGSVTPGSSSTSSNEPSTSASIGEREALARSSDLGVNTIERLAHGAAHLAAQQVEELGGGRGVADLDVVLGGQREEALDARRGVLGALALVAVGEQQHEPRGLAPLVLGGHEVLVDDDLGAVEEVAELRLPDDQRVLVDHRVAVLEAERGVLGQQRVVEPELGAVVWPAAPSGVYSAPVS